MAVFLMTLALPDRTGAARMALQYCTALGEAGHRVVLAHGPGPPRPLPGGEDPTILPDMRRAGVETVAEPGLELPLSRAVVRRVAELARRRRVAAVVGIMQRDRAVAVQAATAAGVPGILSIQNSHVFWGRWPLPRLKRLYYGWVVRRLTSLALCTSEVVRREMVGEFGLPMERTRVLPNAIDVHGFPRLEEERDAARRELGVAPGELLLVNVGRIDRQKGQDLLLRALAGLGETERPLRLVLVGGLSEGRALAQKKRFEQRVTELAGRGGVERRVHFAGWRSDVPRLLAAADLYVHASRWEGPALPLAVLEAMAAARPIVATDCSGHPGGFVDGRHGRIVAAGDTEALAAALRWATSLGEEERREMGGACRRLAEERYDIGVIGRRFVELVEEAL